MVRFFPSFDFACFLSNIPGSALIVLFNMGSEGRGTVYKPDPQCSVRQSECSLQTMAASGRARLDRPTLGCGAWGTTLDMSGSCSEPALSVAQMAQVPSSLWLLQGPLLYTSEEGTRSGEGEQGDNSQQSPISPWFSHFNGMVLWQKVSRCWQKSQASLKTGQPRLRRSPRT